MRELLAVAVASIVLAAGASPASADPPLEVKITVEASGETPAASLGGALTDTTPCTDGRAEAGAVAYDVHICRQGGTDDSPILVVELSAHQVVDGTARRRSGKFTLRIARGGTAPIRLNDTRLSVSVR